MSSPKPETLSSTDPTHVSSTCKAHNLNPDEFATLSRRAAEAKELAYCPYSRFRVGAAVLTADGSFVTGCNVENASYPVGTCAERVALGRAVAEGHVAKEGGGGFRALAVATDVTPPASPCGMCRQFIREFLALDVPIIMFDKNQDYVVLKLEELLPLSFGPDKLPPPGTAGAMG